MKKLSHIAQLLIAGTLSCFCCPLIGASQTLRLDARHVVGFENVPASEDGFLELDDEGLSFKFQNNKAAVSLEQMDSARSGSEHQETGGGLGKLARVAIPYGGGAVLGLTTRRTVGILTIRYRDERLGLHEGVFMLRPAGAIQLSQTLTPKLHDATRRSTIAGPCETVQVSSLRVVAVSDETVPAEFEAAVFEHLIDDLHSKWPANRMLRGSEESATCLCRQVRLTLTQAKKGNAVMRTASGPIGMFVDVTKLHAEVSVSDETGTLVWKRRFEASRRGDRESMGVASSIAKLVSHAVERTKWSGIAFENHE